MSIDKIVLPAIAQDAVTTDHLRRALTAAHLQQAVTALNQPIVNSAPAQAPAVSLPPAPKSER